MTCIDIILCVPITRVLMLLPRKRPPTLYLPLLAGKRLLATGEVVDDILQAELTLKKEQSPAL